MEELSIEQKAKAYDEALIKAKEALDSIGDGYICNHLTKDDIIQMYANLFPQLRESYSERLRKAIIEHFAGSHSSMYPYKGFTKKEILDWFEKQDNPTDINPSEFDLRLNKLLKQFETLSKEELANCLSFYLNVVQNNGTYREEKQGGQKPNKVEPKFKAGDWIVFNGLTLCVRVVVNGFYVTTSRDGVTNNYDCSIDNAARLWTIQDAKDGDVLADDASVILFRKIGNKKYEDVVDYHCVVDSGKFEIQEKDFYWGKINDIPQLHPATKEQRDALMKAMADAGYTFDFEKKELKKIEQKPVEWHREDEQSLNACLGYIPDEFLRRWLKDIVHAKYDKTAYSEKDKKNFEPKFKVGDII